MNSVFLTNDSFGIALQLDRFLPRMTHFFPESLSELTVLTAATQTYIGRVRVQTKGLDVPKGPKVGANGIFHPRKIPEGRSGDIGSEIVTNYADTTDQVFLKKLISFCRQQLIL